MTLCAALALGTAHADRLLLKDGRELVGKVERVGDRVRLVGRFGEVEFLLDEVSQVIREATPWERWERSLAELRPGDLQQVLALAETAREHRVSGEIRGLLRRGAAPEVVRADDPLLLDVVALCDRWGRGEQALALLIHAASAQPAVRAALEARDYHLLVDEWLPADVYYPRIGWVRWEGSWYPPEQLPVLRARRALHLARGRVGTLREAEAAAQGRLMRSRSRLSDYAAGASQAEAAVAALSDELAVRERDLDRAQGELDQATGDRAALAASSLGCEPPPRGRRDDSAQARYDRARRERALELDRLDRRITRAQEQLKQVRLLRDRALAQLQAARGQLARYAASQSDAEGQVRAAEAELAQLPAALDVARGELRQAEQDLAAAERAARH